MNELADLMAPVESGLVTRIVVWCVLVGLIAYDIPCALFGWPTITACVRKIDDQTGCLFRWGWLALWCHFFVGWGNK